MIKSPLRYPGGKSKAIKFIAPLIPSFDEYREPFVGGGSVFIYLKQKFPDKKFWINDIYENLFLFWCYVKYNPSELCSQIQFWRNKFKNGKELYKFLSENISSFNNIQKAAAFFVFNRITFSGTTESGGFSDAAFHKRFTPSSIKRIQELSTIMENVIITNFDYQKVVEEKGENVFIFLDPPYYSATKSALYGKKGELHKSFDHERFANVLKNIQHKWLITYDNSDYIKDLFSFAYIKEWNLTYGMRNVGKSSIKTGRELFISNYPLSFNKTYFFPSLFDSI
ncbi:MAG: DNA methyltransferase [Bacteroidia bacterium]|nr:MAG: DNA methyltransferase [Bacteroidia bacterium]